MKHTPGPWHYINDVVMSDDDDYICDVHTTTYDGLLIAAAPDLLEALIAVVDMGYNDSPDIWKQVDAAIAKATAQSVE